MKALITGITGFVGGWLAEHLLAAGDSVLGCSQSGDWLAASPGGAVRRIPLARFSLGDPAGLSPTEFQRIADFAPDCIYHLAGLAKPTLCGKAAPTDLAMRVNVGGTQSVVDLALRLDPRPKILFVSSSYAYAAAAENDRPVNEETPTRARGGYGQSKLLAEQLLLAAAKVHALDVVIARAFQHTGPRQGAGYMLPTWAWQCARGGTRPIWAYNSHVQIDVTDVRDVVSAYRLLALNGLPRRTYNVGSGVAHSTGDILGKLVNLASPGRAIRIQHDIAKFDPIANIQRLVDCTGWRPEITLDQTLLDTYDYWRKRRGHRS